MSTRKIQWSPHSYTFNKQRNIFSKSEEPSPYDELEVEEDLNQLGVSGYIIDSPMGRFIEDDELNPYRHFEFWLGHTNFDISKEVSDTIMTVPGVEVFYVMTRYRFILGVGALFPFKDVRADIQEKLCGTSVDIKSLLGRVKSLQDMFTEQAYKDSAIYVLPNGKIDFCYLEKDESNLDEYNAKKELLIQASNLSKGKLYLNEQDRTITTPQE